MLHKQNRQVYKSLLLNKKSIHTWRRDEIIVPIYDFHTTAQSIENTIKVNSFYLNIHNDKRYRIVFQIRSGWSIELRKASYPCKRANAAIVIKLPIIKLIENLAGRTNNYMYIL